ncbi:MAG: hypothetical protein WD801_07945 [Gemmatimonadaceae bacterium]
MFEHLRRSLDELLQRATKPEERRTVMARMRSTLVQVRMGVDDLRDALAVSQRKLEGEQRELATVRRRKELALGIRDAETVAVAERFERQHEERARILEDKIAIQTREVELADRELEEMKAELRKAMTGIPAPPPGAPLDDPLADTADARAEQELEALLRARARTDRDADADRRLEELKRKMGK